LKLHYTGFTSGTCLKKKGQNGYINEQLQATFEEFWSTFLDILEQLVAKANKD